MKRRIGIIAGPMQKLVRRSLFCASAAASLSLAGIVPAAANVIATGAASERISAGQSMLLRKGTRRAKIGGRDGRQRRVQRLVADHGLHIGAARQACSHLGRTDRLNENQKRTTRWGLPGILFGVRHC